MQFQIRSAVSVHTFEKYVNVEACFSLLAHFILIISLKCLGFSVFDFVK